MKPYIYDELCRREKKDWWFVGRQKIISAILQRYLKGKKNLSIVDIGCGAGNIMDILGKFGTVRGVDNNKEIVKFNRENGKEVFLGDICKLKLPEKSFHLVTLLEVLEHVEDDNRALKMVRHILKPEGLIIVTVPAFPFLWGSHDVEAFHKRRYSKKELEDKLSSAGFTLVKVSYINTFLFLPISLIRILKNIFNLGRGKSDFIEYPFLANFFLEKIFSLEAKFLTNFNFPVGVSILAVARRR